MNQRLLSHPLAIAVLLVASNGLAHAARVTENSIRDTTEVASNGLQPYGSAMMGGGMGGGDMYGGGAPFQQAPDVSAGHFQGGGSYQQDPYAVGGGQAYGGRYEVGSKREEIVHRPNRFWGFLKGTGKRFFRFYGGLGRGTLNLARFVFPWIGDRVIDAGFEVGSGVAYAGRAAGREIRSGYREMKAEWGAEMRANSANAKWKQRAAQQRAQTMRSQSARMSSARMASSPMIGRASSLPIGGSSPMMSAMPSRAATYLELESTSADEYGDREPSSEPEQLSEPSLQSE